MRQIDYFLKTIFTGLLLVAVPVLMAQQVVTGRITDADDGTPVPGASVFIANTTIGTATDLSGNYSFTVPGTGSFEIAVSHIGYRSVIHKIDIPKDFHQYDVALKTNELDEITISATKTYRNSDVDLFWNTLLGEKPSKRGIEVLNPENIYFYKRDNVLKASSREPIEMVNHRTGYHIRYILQSFEYNYRSKEFTLFGVPNFEELIPQNDHQKDQWDKRRKAVFAVSLTRFMRALYRKQIHEEGFLLVDREQLMQGKSLPVLLEDIVQTGKDIALVTIKEPLSLICFSIPVSAQMIGTGYDVWMRGTSPILTLMPQQIRIYSDGTYTGLLVAQEHRGSLLGLSSTVPVEYANLTALIATGTDKENATNYLLNKVEENITTQLEAFQQEKIHLHTDRDVYIPGEKIRFKAYVVDANSHQNLTESWYVYAELISPADTLVNRVMITQTDGIFHGYLPISDMIPKGNYTLRAYTRAMENLGDDYFFKKNIQIAGNRGSGESRGNRGSGENQEKTSSPLGRLGGDSGGLGGEFDVSFFPEGGNLPEGVFSKVAFKALNNTGYPETITGTLVDNTGVEIASVTTNYAGMGIVSYNPEAGKRYFLKCRNENGLEKQFELPRANPRTRALAISSDDTDLRIEVKRSAQAPNTLCYILVHCRGTVIDFSEWDGKQEILLPVEDLPAGVIQIVLFDRQMNPLSERLVFGKNYDETYVEFQTDKNTYQIRDKVIATLSLPPSLSWRVEEGLWGGASFSVSVTNDKDIDIDESTTILSTLLLSSELKGYIENPAYYLQNDAAMDLLMMTHGWRRYNIPEVAKGKIESPRIPFQQFQAISGHVRTANIFIRPVRDSEILIQMKGGGFGVTSTDVNGLFVMPELDFPDSTTFFIQALNRSGGDNVRLTVDAEKFPTPVYAQQSLFARQKTKNSEIKDNESGEDTFIQKAEQRAKFDEDIRTLQLDEITVTAQRIERRDTPRLQFWANSASDHTIPKETFERKHYNYVSDYIASSMPGVRVLDNGEIYIRSSNISSYTLDGYPLVLIDGIAQEWPGKLRNRYDSPVERIPVNSIESIDVFNGPSAAAFGARGANGVISITTKRGGSDIPIERFNRVVYTPLGYQKPAEFYSPKYETLATLQSNIPDYRTTIFWKPDLVISAEEATFEFYTSDFRTTYSVVIEGITTDGKIIRQIEKISVE